jgi:hypothetical protein
MASPRRRNYTDFVLFITEQRSLIGGEHGVRRRLVQRSRSRLIVSAQLTAHSMLRRDGTEMVSTIDEVDTTDERSLKPFET